MAGMITFLHVEDDAVWRALVRSAFARLGLDGELIQASGVDAAERWLAVRRFEVVLTDHYLDKGTGLDVLIAARRLQPGCYVAAQSALDDPTLRAAYAGGGVDAFAVKPTSLRELLDMLGELYASGLLRSMRHQAA